MSDKDNIYTDNESMIVDFSFDEKVVKVFPDMIRRSVPGYESIITMIGLLAEEYAQQDSNIYDLGCSLGAATLAMIRNVKESGCNIIAVDNAKAMIEKCQSNPDFKNNHIETTWRYSDIQDIDIDNASVVVMNFTLQFIPPVERFDLIQKIYNGLKPGGVLILSEKIIFANELEQDEQERLHLAFKKANGYSDLEISQKRNALENILLPDTLLLHQERLHSVGFSRSQVWFQCFNFASLLAIK